ISMEWARIPHFYYNFYVYKYATGFSAASAITSAILGGDLDVDDYLGMLKAGGSEPPLELLRRVNIDLTEPSTLNRGLVLFDGLVNDLDGML
ncbi:MAG TPA: oligoendopeptidase F, partial [Euryarchaeota archaeon]|nr:oligoendopeptidase F [Euryarchaeota archaeon]